MSGYVNEDGTSNTYSSINDYMATIKEIVNSSGLFRNRYNQVAHQVNSINSIVDQFNSAILPSLKHDMLDIFESTVDWDDLHNKLSVDIKSKPKYVQPDLKPFKFNVEPLEPLQDELLVNMNMTMSEIDMNENNLEMNAKRNKKHITRFNGYKHAFIQEADNFMDSIKECEDKAVECRNRNVNIMKHNINELYKIHARYAYNNLHKLKKNTEQITYKNNEGKDVNIPMCKSQKKFITDALKIMLSND